MRRARLLVAVAVGALCAGALALLVLTVFDDDGSGERREVVVSATAEDRLVPDVARVRLGVSVRAPSAREAMRVASRSLDSVVEALRRMDVAEIQSEPARLRRAPPEDRGEDGGAGAPPGTLPRPYIASQAVSVRIRDLRETGRVIDGAVEAGATEVLGPYFSLADPSRARRRAVAAAVAEARRKAQAMAGAAGLRLGGVVRVSEGAARPVAVRTGRAAEERATPPIEPGRILVTAAVTVAFAAEPAEGPSARPPEVGEASRASGLRATR